MDPIDNEGAAPNVTSDTDSPQLTDDEVGYGKPPMIRRFKLGNSDNKPGRPLGSKNRKTIVKKIANEMHTVTEEGRQRQRSTLELMLLTLRNRAAEGDVPAFDTYMKYLMKSEPQESNSKLGYLVVPAQQTMEEAKVEGEKANAEAAARRAAQSRG